MDADQPNPTAVDTVNLQLKLLGAGPSSYCSSEQMGSINTMLLGASVSKSNQLLLGTNTLPANRRSNTRRIPKPSIALIILWSKSERINDYQRRLARASFGLLEPGKSAHEWQGRWHACRLQTVFTLKLSQFIHSTMPAHYLEYTTKAISCRLKAHICRTDARHHTRDK